MVNTYFYKIYNTDTPTKNVYIGSTCNINDRWRNHKSNIKNKNNRLYKFIRENGGIEKWTYMVLMQRNIPNDDDERYIIEAELINQYDIKNCLNKNIPNNFKQYETREEYDMIRNYKNIECEICGTVYRGLPHKRRHERTKKCKKGKPQILI
jgi:hypothetical protein